PYGLRAQAKDFEARVLSMQSRTNSNITATAGSGVQFEASMEKAEKVYSNGSPSVPNEKPSNKDLQEGPSLVLPALTVASISYAICIVASIHLGRFLRSAKL
ncbi:hypothetical protein H0H93_006653, partial [Arthromyces matolae]